MALARNVDDPGNCIQKPVKPRLRFSQFSRSLNICRTGRILRSLDLFWAVFLPTLALLPPCIAASSCANLDNNFLTSTRTQGTKDLKARFCAALWQVGRFEGYRLQAVIHFSYGGHWQFYIHKDGIRNLEPCFLLVGYRVSSYNVISQVVLQLPSGRFNGYDKKN